ncbi:MAG: NADH-quinone oxidoreductase subunit N [Actinomycetes bacterium]|jgi:NADH-quinone oxidoreductase subunit N
MLPDINWLAIFPELTLALGAALVLLVEVQWKPKASTLAWVGGWVVLLSLIFTAFQWIWVGANQETPDRLFVFSDMLITDGMAVYGRFAVLGVLALGLATAVPLLEALGRRAAEAIAIAMLSAAGFSLMLSANNLVLVFLGLEVGSIALYVLAGLTRERKGSDEAALKYFLLGSFASALFVYGVALLYAGTGEFTISGIRQLFSAVIIARPAVILIGLGLMLAGMGFKVSAAPFHAWAPDVYQGAPAGIVGYMAGVAKVAGFITMARIFVTGLIEYQASWAPVVSVVAALSMVIGSVVALAQTDVRRMLAYSGVAHAGFALTGIVAGQTDGVLFYVVAYAVQLIGGFAVISAVSGPEGSGSDLSAYRGLWKRNPGLAAGFALLLFGMAGIPLTSGFVAKFGVFSEVWGSQPWLVILGVIASVVTLAFYLRITVTMYMEGDEGETVVARTPTRWVVWIAVALTILWGVLPGSLLSVVADAFSL